MQREHVSNGSSLNEISKQSLSMSMEKLVAERTPMTYFRETWSALWTPGDPSGSCILLDGMFYQRGLNPVAE
jgi:hypothetical protein